MNHITSAICLVIGGVLATSVSASGSDGRRTRTSRYPMLSSYNNVLSYGAKSEEFEDFGEISDYRNRNSDQVYRGSDNKLNFDSFPVPKPYPPHEDSKGPYFIDHHHINDIPAQHFIACQNWEEPLPYKFDISENSITYDFGSSNADQLTSAQKMLQVSTLISSLVPIYSFFDSFDIETFATYLKEKQNTLLKHPYLRYHLVKDLVSRASKTANPDSIIRFLEILDVLDNLLFPQTVGKYEMTAFEEFKSFAKKQNFSSKHLSDYLNIFLSNEESRVYPLRKLITESKYQDVIQVLETSDRKVFMTNSDFELLLANECCDERYKFLLEVIEHGHFHAYDIDLEADKNYLVKAVMNKTKSYDIMAALLITHGSELKAFKTKSGKDALYFAKNNKDLSSKRREKTVELLKIENITERDIERLLNH